MTKLAKKWKQSVCWTCVTVLALAIGGNQTKSSEIIPINEEEVQTKLQEIETETLMILEELFQLEQALSISEKKKKDIEVNIESKQDEILRSEETMVKETLNYTRYLTNMEVILTTYQRMGPTSILGILLEADSLKDFVRRISVLRDYTRQTEVLLLQIQSVIDTLERLKVQLLKEQTELEQSKNDLELVMADYLTLLEEKENYLESLEEERVYYEEQLNVLTDAWKQLKPVFKEASIGFSELVDSGSLTEDMIDVTISLLGIKATIQDTQFNQAIKDYDKLPNMVFTFKQDEVAISLLDGVLELRGEFQVKEDYQLNYVAKSGVFYGVPLEKNSLDELFEEGELILDLRQLTLNNKVKGIEIKDGKMILDIAFSLF
jgi:peptidoglycan hydrolase CwlO-like protein